MGEDGKREYNEPHIGALHSERKKNAYHQRLPSRSHSVSITPFHRRDESATNSKSKSKTKELMEEKKAESEDRDEGRDKVSEFDDCVSNGKKHFNYSPVNRTESAESIKVSFKPKQTFVEKWQCNELDEEQAVDDSANEKESKHGLLSKLKKKSSRFLKLNQKQNSNQHSYTSVQNPDIGLNDFQ